jgi:hypothetical protein
MVEDIAVLQPGSRTERRPVSHSQSEIVVESPVPLGRYVNTGYMPSGFTSAPMTRDPSREMGNLPHTTRSDYTIAGSAPQRTLSDTYVLGVDAPGTYGFNLQDPALYIDQQIRGRQQMEFGQFGRWAGAHSADIGQDLALLDRDVLETQPRHSEALQFGDMDPVSIEEARARVDITRARSADSSTRGRSRGVHSVTHNERSH